MHIPSLSNLLQSTFGSALPSRDARLYPRINQEFYVQVNERNFRGNKIHHSVTQDVSSGGMKLLSFCRLPAASKMTVQFGCPGEFERISVIGMVAWDRPTEDGDHWISGITFEDLDNFSKSRIARLVESYSDAPESIQEPAFT